MQFKRASDFKTELADYGLNQDLLDGLEAVIDDFSDKKPAPANAKKYQGNVNC